MELETTTLTRKADIAHARKVDNEVARLFGLFHDTDGEMRAIVKDIERNVKFANASYNQSERRQAEYAERIAKLEKKLDELRPVREERRQAAHDYNKANYGGWNRFFHVIHIHKDMNCSSFRPTTRVGWLPDVSGLTVEEAVATHGETLCTKCYPDAPVALTVKPVDDSVCTGTIDRDQPRSDPRYRSRWATCTCGQRVAVTTTGKLRKHKKA